MEYRITVEKIETIATTQGPERSLRIVDIIEVETDFEIEGTGKNVFHLIDAIRDDISERREEQ